MCHIRDVRQVLRQGKLAAVLELDAVLAVLRALVADHADDGAREDTCHSEHSRKLQLRTGTQKKVPGNLPVMK